jgi:hypothetical protein
MKKITLLICILFLVTSCEIQYDGETKIAVTGKLIDENGNPIAKKDIQIDVLDGPGLILPGSDLISFGKSDQNGNFTLIFPAPIEGNRISISINDIINQFDEYQSKNIIAKKINFENYKLNLDKITLYRKESITTLQLIPNKTSTNKQISNIKIEGKQPNSYIDLNPMQDNTNYFQPNYNVLKNQTIIVKYTIIDYSTNSSTVQSISIPIVNDAVIYTITY